jgi:hypothetical protein
MLKSIQEYAYAESNYYESSTEKDFYPHRAIIDEKFCYIWNSYVILFKGEKKFMQSWMYIIDSSLNDNNPRFLTKINSIVNKPVEEFYDLEKDPGCWNKLAKDEQLAYKIQ